MSATARKTGSKATAKNPPKRTPKRVPAEVVSFVEARSKKILKQVSVEMEALERELDQKLEDLARSNPLIAAAMKMSDALHAPVTPEQIERYDAALNDRATEQQMEARREAYERALEHNAPASDEAVAAIVAEWD